MKLVFIINSLSEPGGGAERVLANVSSALAGRGHDVTVASFDDGTSADFYSFAPAVNRIRLGGARQPAGILRRIFSARRLVRRVRPDVVIGFMHSAFIPQAVALANTGVPLVASEHTVFNHYRTVPFELSLLLLSSWLIAAFTAVSHAARASYPSSLQRKMVVISNPVTLAPEDAADVLGGERKILLSVGGLTALKDHGTLVRAFARISRQFPDWDLRIVGQGPLRDHILDEGRRGGIEDRVAICAATRHIGSEYARAQLFAMPSKYESFGLATAEALAHGLPVVGFADCPGTNELIEDGVNGVLVEAEDRVAALSDGLARLMGSAEERVRMGEAAPQSVEQYSLERVTDQWEDLLTRVAKHGAAR
jgi:glycosyltransferase involved in cell wall biosynthesis